MASTPPPRPGRGPVAVVIRTVFYGLLLWWAVRNFVPVFSALVIYSAAWHKQIKSNHRGLMFLASGLLVFYGIVGSSLWAASALAVAIFLMHRQILMAVDFSGPAHWLASMGQIEALDLCVNFGIDAEAPSMIRKQTPLHFASVIGQERSVSLLLKKGAHVKAKDPMNITPLHLAASMGHTSVCKLLIEGKCPVDVKANSSATPLHFAAESVCPSKETISLLLEAGASADGQDDAGGTALQRLAYKGQEECVKVLLARGAKIDTFSKSGATALHLAAMAERTNVVSLLVSKGANKKAKITAGVYAGKTPLELTNNVATRVALGEKMPDEAVMANEILTGTAAKFSSK